MSIFHERDRSGGERGEWTQLRYAAQARDWRSWRGAQVLIGPVSYAHILDSPTDLPNYENMVDFDENTLVSPGSTYYLRNLPTPYHRAVHGLHVWYPSIFDKEERSFGPLFERTEAMDGLNEVTDMWIPDQPELVVMAHRSEVPTLDSRHATMLSAGGLAVAA